MTDAEKIKELEAKIKELKARLARQEDKVVSEKAWASIRRGYGL